ncbi:MAG: hypothetical protein GY851_02720, partial [bacterium]|nr:hypothetical protein [bacterium]
MSPFVPTVPICSHLLPHLLNVLYMDGHVEFIRYPGESPASVA